MLHGIFIGFGHIFKRKRYSESFILFYTQFSEGQQFKLLYTGIFKFERIQFFYAFFIIADTRNYHMAYPRRFIYLITIPEKLIDLFEFPAGIFFMLIGVGILYIKQHKIRNIEQLFYVFINYTAACIYTGIYSVGFKRCKQLCRKFALQQDFSARQGYSAFFSVIQFKAIDFFSELFYRTPGAFGEFPSIGIMAAGAAQRAALKEHD